MVEDCLVLTKKRGKSLKQCNDSRKMNKMLIALGYRPYSELTEAKVIVRKKKYPIKGMISQLYDFSFLFTMFSSVLIGGKHDSFEALVLVIIYSIVGWAFLCKTVIQNGSSIKENLFPYIAYGVFIYVFARMRPSYRQNFTAYYGLILLALILVVSIDLAFKFWRRERKSNS